VAVRQPPFRAAFDAVSHTGRQFSSISNLSVGDLVAFKTTGGVTPATNKLIKLTQISGCEDRY
jgi:hypothetical protein